MKNNLYIAFLLTLLYFVLIFCGAYLVGRIEGFVSKEAIRKIIQHWKFILIFSIVPALPIYSELPVEFYIFDGTAIPALFLGSAMGWLAYKLFLFK